ncbi:MAG: cation:dicarboxylase symporter family transporter [Alphaproteobacteria bacterium]|nr:cation:dicarboxylase symporter family transporter [Alphaproteobacteria bacterium]
MSVGSILLKILQDPKVILGSVILGFFSGLYARDFSHSLKPFAEIYVSLLSMCLLPILVSALVWGIGQMLRNPRTQVLFGRMAVIYACGLVIPCVVTIVVVLILQPGNALSPEAAAALGGEVPNVPREREAVGLMGFLGTLAPPNVFEALSTGRFISIVFFCALAGLALGVVRSPGADEALRVVNAFYQTFAKVFHWVLVPLPLGLFSIVAYHLSEANTELIVALGEYILAFWVAGLLVLAIHIAVLSAVCRVPPWRPLIWLKSPLVLAFATDNPFVALYSAIESLREHFGVHREVADTIVPFGVLANQHGQIVLFTITAIFLAQVYEVDLDLATLIVLGLGATIAGAAAVGGGPALAPILAPVLLGAGVPDVLAFVIFATTQPAVANLGSTLTVQATCNLAVLTVHGRSQTDPATEAAEQAPASAE